MISVNYQNLAKLLVESAKVIGKAFSDPTTPMIITAIIGTSLTTGLLADEGERHDLKADITEDEEKALLLKQALVEHEAIIDTLRRNAAISKERQDYLESLNDRLLKQMQICKDENSNEQI